MVSNFRKYIYSRSSRPEGFCWSSVACKFIKRRLWCRCFPVNIGKFLRTPSFIEHLQWLHLLSDCNWTGTQKHLVRKQTLNQWPVWPNGWVFVYELSASGFESSCNRLTFRFHACFEQGVPWHSGNFRVWIHSVTRTWHDKNIQPDCIFYSEITIGFY